ncbi:hypothetical protein NG798_19630 [Ancylothrix sp. C2]|uniref:hypothetical protein n=1 Tax=Ancylothrix sp. D3o TaxID=2953691 RepID=UPI0021BA85C6|nr:hypothetical protein [Ancylothrix sp. D3o]MCT7952013.1 hypothetical protein [Ancylothrix sp. D3o]
MTKVTFEEIAQFRTQLAAYEQALKALDVIEDCEGDLEDAALVLAIEVGQQPDGPEWLDGFAKRCRVAICEENLREDFLNGKYGVVMDSLQQKGVCPAILGAPVLMYVVKKGIQEFCEPLELKL